MQDQLRDQCNFIQEYFGMTDEEMAVYFPTDIPRNVDDVVTLPQN